MTTRGVVSALCVAIFGVCTLGAPVPVGAAAMTRPTDLRPVQSKADCATALSLAAFICGAGVTQGDLQLIWNDSEHNVTGYKVYRVDGGGHVLLGTSAARYFLVKKPSGGYANLCFAVAGTAGNETSADSEHYCYAPGATATTRTFKPSHSVTQVTWKVPYVACSSTPVPASSYFQAADKYLGGAFTAIFPFLTNEQQLSGRVGVSGVSAGNQAALLKININDPDTLPWGGKAFCTAPKNMVADVTVDALAGAAFNLGELSGHKLYSAALTLKSSQTVQVISEKAMLTGGWCPTFVGAANREWWLSPLGNLTYGDAGRVSVVSKPTAPIDVTPIVSKWASTRYASNYGFIVGNPLPPGAVPVVSNACVMKFSTPSLQVIYF